MEKKEGFLMKSIKKWFRSSMLIASAAVMVACGNGGVEENSQADSKVEEETTEGDTIKIGSVFERTGYGAAYGNSQADAILMAAEEINENGGVLGQEIEIVEYDNKTDDAETAQIVMRLSTEDNVVATIGPSYTGGFLAALPIAEQNGMPYFGSSIGADDVTLDENGEVYEYIWRLATQIRDQASAMTGFAYQNMNAKTAVILADNSTDYGDIWTKALESTFEGEIIGIENFSPDQTDFSATLTKINGMEFDALFLPGYYEQIGPIVKQAREMGMTVPIYGSDGFGNPIAFELAGAENSNDIYYPTEYYVEGDNPETVNFREKFKEKFGREPDMFSGLAYDSLYIIAQAVENAGEVTPDAVNAALAETDYDGLLGNVTFNDVHDANRQTPVVEVQNGEAVAVHQVGK